MGEELNLLRKGPLKFWCDNKSAINIANNPVQHDQTKYVEIDHFFIKEKIDDGILQLSHVNSEGQITTTKQAFVPDHLSRQPLGPGQ